MTQPVASWRSHRARVGALSRDRAPDDPDLAAARRDLTTSRLEDHVRRALTGEHPPTPEQRARIAAILVPR